MIKLSELKENGYSDEYVLVNDKSPMTGVDELEEEIYWLIKEDNGDEIKVHPGKEECLSLDADSIVETLFDNGIIHEDSDIPRSSLNELQEFLDKWCERTKEEVSICYDIDYKTEIDVSEIVEKMKKVIEKEDENK